MSTTVANGLQGWAAASGMREEAAAQRIYAAATGGGSGSRGSASRRATRRHAHSGGSGSGGRGTKGKRDWGLFFSGVALFIAGLIVAFWPGLTLVTIAAFVGVMMLIAGVFDMVAYVRFRKKMEHSGWALVNALCNLVLGAMFLLHPIITAAVIPWVAGAFVAGYGVIAIVSAVRLRKVGPGWGLMLANGIVSVLCGIMFVFLPVAFAVFLGVFLAMRGVTMATFGLIAPTNVPYV
ncbi:HdeD family acid-resistance protein [Adlercreutzia sp. ZJ473]|uniref:HdeD family acid-resistance protein n=1 Tax=Adlercreutzia sp. ZJ473 TaxID=2722822 RepID=UPI0020A6B91E|nr:DUF308 domain-containing protein [Adlercreutzia sp. ZJ473]